MQFLVLAAAVVSAMAASAVALRLLWLLRRERSVALLLLGIALLAGSGLGQLLMLALAVLEPAPGSGLWRGLLAAMLASIGTGATCICAFNHQVFRGRSAWLHAATGLVGAHFALVSSSILLGFEREGPLAGQRFFLVLFLLYTWSAAESLRCWLEYRRSPGLDPLVVERFRVWAIGAFCAAVWVGAGYLGGLHPLARGVGALFGLALATTVWLAFAPPEAFRRRLRAATVEGRV